MLVETGYWPDTVDFDHKELQTVVTVIKERAKEIERVRKRKH